MFRNIIAIVLVSNGVIRSLALGEVVGFFFADMIKDLGLIFVEFMLVRSSIVRYVGR